jgi:hypothetical protein
MTCTSGTQFPIWYDAAANSGAGGWRTFPGAAATSSYIPWSQTVRSNGSAALNSSWFNLTGGGGAWGNGLGGYNQLSYNQSVGINTAVPTGWLNGSPVMVTIELQENGCTAGQSPSHSVQYAILDAGAEITTVPSWTGTTPLGYTAIGNATLRYSAAIPVTPPSGSAGKTYLVRLLRNSDGLSTCVLRVSAMTINWRLAVQ